MSMSCDYNCLRSSLIDQNLLALVLYVGENRGINIIELENLDHSKDANFMHYDHCISQSFMGIIRSSHDHDVVLISCHDVNKSPDNNHTIVEYLLNIAMQEIKTVPVQNHDEDTPLLPGRTRSWLAMRYGNTRKCVSSKAALLILLWGFVVGLVSGLLINLEFYNFIKAYFAMSLYGGAVLITCFFPLAGILADIKYGRYKTVITSLYIVLISLLPAAVIVAIITPGYIFLWPQEILVVLDILGGIMAILLYVGLIGFTANVVQFGMDQLHDSPAEDSTLFIHW